MMSSLAHADAGWQLCNQTSYIIEAAIGRPESEGVRVRGWLRLRSGECREASPAPLTLADHYVYARASAGHRGGQRFWTGSSPYCIRPEGTFALRQPDPCRDEKMQTVAFVSVPVKQRTDKTTWLREARDYTLKQAQTAGLQRLLNDSGVARVNIDGQIGRRTRQSIQTFLRQKGLPTGISDKDLIDVLENEAHRQARRFGMDLCNHTRVRLWAAVGLFGNKTWESRGWWSVDSNSCVRVIDETLAERPYYVYAEMETLEAGSRLRGASRNFCISRSKFVIAGAEDCRARHYDEAGFVVTEAPDGGRLLIEFTRADFQSAPGDAG